MLEFTVLRNIAKMFIWLDYHFLEPKDFASIVGEEEFKKYGGPDFYAQKPVDVFRQFHFQPMGSSTTAIKEVRIQQVQQAYQLFNQDPFINQIELRKMVMDVMELRNESKLLIEDPVKYAQLLMQQTGQVPPGGPGGPPGGGGPQGQPPAGGPGEGGLAPQKGPSPPQPGGKALTPEAQISEMMRVAGGGLVRGGQGLSKE
jgi:hypothetical protein